MPDPQPRYWEPNTYRRMAVAAFAVAFAGSLWGGRSPTIASVLLIVGCAVAAELAEIAKAIRDRP